MRPDRSLPPPPTERQLALPFETVAGPPALSRLGPVVPPQRVWRSLAPATQITVRQAIRRICQEVVDDDAAGR